MISAFLTVVNRSITASIFAIVIFLVRHFLKKYSYRFVLFLWLLLSVRLLVPNLPATSFGIMEEEIIHVSDNRISGENAMDADSISYGGVSETTDIALSANIDSIDNLDVPGKITGTGQNKGISILQLLSFVWVSIFCALLLFMILQYYVLRRRYTNRKHLRDNIYLSGDADNSFVIGYVSPIIILPDNLEEDRMEYIILHERAHIWHGDHIWKTMGYVMACLHWLNPMAWIAYYLFAKDMEFACDERVCRKLSMEEKCAYSRILLLCSVVKPLDAMTVRFESKNVKQRIGAILTRKRTPVVVTFLFLFVSALLILGGLTNRYDRTESFLKTVDRYVEKAEDDPENPDYIWGESFEMQCKQGVYEITQNGQTYTVDLSKWGQQEIFAQDGYFELDGDSVFVLNQLPWVISEEGAGMIALDIPCKICIRMHEKEIYLTEVFSEYDYGFWFQNSFMFEGDLYEFSNAYIENQETAGMLIRYSPVTGQMEPLLSEVEYARACLEKEYGRSLEVPLMSMVPVGKLQQDIIYRCTFGREPDEAYSIYILYDRGKEESLYYIK